MCPNCKSENVRNYHVDADLNELTEEQLNDMTVYEKEVAAQSECLDCYHTDVTEYFNDNPSIFKTLGMILKP
jgi:hypothetical protein